MSFYVPLARSASFFKKHILKVSPEKLSLRRFLFYGVSDPLFMFSSLLGLHVADAIRLSRFLNVDLREVFEFYKEATDLKFLRYIKAKYILAEKLAKIGGGLDLYLAPYLYIIVRVLKPRVVVETGVGPGVSTSFILYALERNGFGELFSIDLPEADQEIYISMGIVKEFHRYSPEGWGPGWLVPDWLKERWHLILGDSRRILPKLLRDLRYIDIFLHDSLHTYEHMIFEYSVAWKHLSPNGILLSDDVGWNNAFYDFCNVVRAKKIVIMERLGLAMPMK